MRDLMPLASLVTPNLAEAAALLDTRVARTLPDVRLQATALQELGAQRVLIKGGHLEDAESIEGSDEALDLLLDVDGEAVLRAPRVKTLNTHGTGCTLSSAIAAGLAKGMGLAAASREAKTFVSAAIAASQRLVVGSGHGPVHHFHAWW
jgi:hydroxymethylpyrimidine/phosphomethylpyrimidine kinase